MTVRRFLPLAAGFALLLSGCGGPVMAPVKGKITCNGKPVKAAAVTFSPVPASEGDKEAGKPATGFTEEDGTFVLSTFKTRDGAIVGQHKVLVMIDETNPAKCPRETRITWEVKPGDNVVEIELAK